VNVVLKIVLRTAVLRVRPNSNPRLGSVIPIPVLRPSDCGIWAASLPAPENLALLFFICFFASPWNGRAAWRKGWTYIEGLEFRLAPSGRPLAES